MIAVQQIDHGHIPHAKRWFVAVCKLAFTAAGVVRAGGCVGAVLYRTFRRDAPRIGFESERSITERVNTRASACLLW